MKKLLVLLGIVIGFNVNAWRYEGGIITVTQVNNNAVVVKMNLLHHAADIHHPHNIPYPLSTIMNYHKVDSTSISLSTLVMHLDTFVNHQDYHYVTYTSNVLTLDHALYRFIWHNLHQYGYIDNAIDPASIRFSISTDYLNTPGNSLPELKTPFGVNIQVNSLNTINPLFDSINGFFTTPNNDSIYIKETGIYNCYNTTTGTMNIYPSTPLNMNISPNSISWIPLLTQKYGTGFEITSIKNVLSKNGQIQNGDTLGIQRMQWTFNVVNSTIGLEENQLDDLSYKVYDWNGRYMGENINWAELKGLYVIRYSNGKTEKVFCN